MSRLPTPFDTSLAPLSWPKLAWVVGAAAVFLGLLISADALQRAAPPALARAVWPASQLSQPSQASESAPSSLPALTALSGFPKGRLVLAAQGHLPMPANVPSAHASNLLALPASHPAALVAFWFLGTRESGPDVQIAASFFDRTSQRWAAPQTVVSRQSLGDALGLGVRRIGNPVAWLDPQGRIHLFVVATGLGGWAAGRIVHLVQRDAVPNQMGGTMPTSSTPIALQFDNPRLLPLSWLWNTSFLVRGAPLPLSDGGMVLPVYFELGIKYPVALRFDAAGNMTSVVRISSRRHLLQPTLLALGESSWLALMRTQRRDGHIAAAQTDDAGRTWRDLPDLALTNPDASVFGVSPLAGVSFLAHNSSLHNRQKLDLSQSANGSDWALVAPLAAGGEGAEYSYPAMAWADNSLWVSYTDHRRSIAWQRFNWVAGP